MCLNIFKNKKITKIETNKSKNYYFNTTTIQSKKYSPRTEFEVINIFPDKKYQEFIGFGGALTEAAAYAYSLLPEDKKQSFMKDYFSEIKYSLCRISIGSCDFSLGSYSYSSKKDLSDFSIEKDKKYIIPFIKDALKINPNLKFLASPWSPPSFMKSNKTLLLGGKLMDKYKQLYAEYFVKFINAYSELGIKIDYVTIQNEPNATQTWESCIFTPEEEANFLVNYLYPTFQKNNINTKILIYDQNKDKIYSRALAEFSNEKAREAAAGIAFHWYTGDHFESLALCKETFPEKLLIHTEGCAGFSKDHFHENGYAKDIIEDFNNGTNAYIDWNVLLDNKGGPNHKFNYCNSPIMLNEDNSDYVKTLAYYYIGHFSKTVQVGARRIAFSKYTSDIAITAFKNPDNTTAVIILNNSGHDVKYNLCMDNIMFKDSICANSIVSYLI